MTMRGFEVLNCSYETVIQTEINYLPRLPLENVLNVIPIVAFSQMLDV